VPSKIQSIESLQINFSYSLLLNCVSLSISSVFSSSKIIVVEIFWKELP